MQIKGSIVELLGSYWGHWEIGQVTAGGEGLGIEVKAHTTGHECRWRGGGHWEVGQVTARGE